MWCHPLLCMVLACGRPAEVLGFRLVLVVTVIIFPLFYLLVSVYCEFGIIPSFSLRWLRPLLSGRGLGDDRPYRLAGWAQ